MAGEVEKLKSDFEVKVGRSKVPLVVARLTKDVVLDDVEMIVDSGNVGCLINEFGNLYFVLDGKVDGIAEGTQIPVHPDEVEIL